MMFYLILRSKGLLNGEVKSYPIVLKVVDGLSYNSITISNQRALFSLIEDYLKDDFNKTKDIKDVIEELNIEPLMLVDGVEEIINDLDYWSSPMTSNAPHDSDVFYNYVLLYEKFKPKAF